MGWVEQFDERTSRSGYAERYFDIMRNASNQTSEQVSSLAQTILPEQVQMQLIDPTIRIEQQGMIDD